MYHLGLGCHCLFYFSFNKTKTLCTPLQACTERFNISMQQPMACFPTAPPTYSLVHHWATSGLHLEPIYIRFANTLTVDLPWRGEQGTSALRWQRYRFNLPAGPRRCLHAAHTNTHKSWLKLRTIIWLIRLEHVQILQSVRKSSLPCFSISHQSTRGSLAVGAMINRVT